MPATWRRVARSRSLGWPQSTRRQLDAAGPYHLISNYAVWVQDDIKLTPSLTLNVGLRYDVMKPPREKWLSDNKLKVAYYIDNDGSELNYQLNFMRSLGLRRALG